VSKDGTEYILKLFVSCHVSIQTFIEPGHNEPFPTDGLPRN
jgi:hypothetical protein